MTEQLVINLPAYSFTGASASATAAKRSDNLWAPGFISPAYEELPEELAIVGFRSWRQAPWVCPGGHYGDITWAVDVQGRYAYEAGFPAIEDINPQVIGLKFLGAHLIEPGAPRLPAYIDFSADPLMIRKGDLIVGAPENDNAASGTGFQIHAGLVVRRASGGDFPLLPGIVWNIGCNGSTFDGAAASRRSLIPNIAAGGTEVRIHVPYGGTMTKASIGVQDTGPDMLATPVPLLFGGNLNVTPPVGGAWSDWVSLNTTQGQSLLVDVRSTGFIPYKNVSPADAWGTYTADTHGTAVMGGSPGLAANRTYYVDAVQVRTP